MLRSSVGLIAMAAGIISLVVFHLTSSVGPDGILREHFPLLPMGYLLLALGGVLACVRRR
jgi:hypothetical protein